MEENLFIETPAEEKASLGHFRLLKWHYQASPIVPTRPEWWADPSTHPRQLSPPLLTSSTLISALRECRIYNATFALSLKQDKT